MKRYAIIFGILGAIYFTAVIKIEYDRSNDPTVVAKRRHMETHSYLYMSRGHSICMDCNECKYCIAAGYLKPSK